LFTLNKTVSLVSDAATATKTSQSSIVMLCVCQTLIKALLTYLLISNPGIPGLRKQSRDYKLYWYASLFGSKPGCLERRGDELLRDGSDGLCVQLVVTKVNCRPRWKVMALHWLVWHVGAVGWRHTNCLQSAAISNEVLSKHTL